MEYLIHLATLFAIYAILGVSVNLIVGYTGLLSASHAAFYGIGAYVTAILLTKSGFGFPVAVVAGMLVAMLIGLLVGMVLSRFNDDYYALASLGFGVIAFSVMLNWHEVTKGPLGIAGIDRPELLGIQTASPEGFLIVAIIALLIIYGVARYLVSMPFGAVLKAIREDEEAIQVFGYDTTRFKLTVFVLAGAMAASAGSLFAIYATYIDPSSFTVMESIFILAIAIVGGLGNLRGSLLGALALVMVPEALRFVGFPPEIAGQMREIVYGALLILLVLYRPKGLLGEYRV